MKVEINNCAEQAKKNNLTSRYWQLDKDVKKSAKKDKKALFGTLATEAESAAGQRNMKRLYDITRTMSGKRSRPPEPVKNKDGVIITEEQEQRARWAEHLRDILNRPPPTEMPNISTTEERLLNVTVNPPSKAKIERALKQLKNGKAAGRDGIPTEALKADPKTTSAMLHPLFLQIWETERVLTKWKNGYLGLFKDCRGIMLLSVPCKVFCRIILGRLKHALDRKLRCEQAGFKKDKSCTDHIAALRIIIEQSTEWQTPLHTNFIDFEKAFDSDRNVIWQLMGHYGVPPKFIKLIQELYEASSCQVIHNGKLSEPFEMNTGVRQGCLLSPMIFIIVVDWIMGEVEKIGIQWTLTTQFHDLDFADDICLRFYPRICKICKSRPSTLH